MAVEVDISRSDPFVDVHSEMGASGWRGGYDIVVAMGELSPVAVALSVLAEAPLAQVSEDLGVSIPDVIEAALADRRIESIPVLQVTVDGDRRFSIDAVDIVTDRPALARWRLGDRSGDASTTACRVRPHRGRLGHLEVRFPGPSTMTCQELQFEEDDLSVRVDFDTRSRRARRVKFEGITQEVGLLKLEPPDR